MRNIGFLILFFFTLHSFAIDGLLIHTVDNAFKDKWNNTLGGSIPKISTCDKVFKHQYFHLTVIAADYSLNRFGEADVEYSIKIIGPDKSTFLSEENLPLLKRKLSNNENLQMADAILKVSFEDEDIFGNYEVQIEINDLVSRKSKTITTDIELVELPSYDKIIVNSEDEFMKWIEKYYESPKPEEALSYYLYYAQSSLSDDEKSFWSIFSIFYEITRTNKFLNTQIIDCYEKQDLKTKIYLVYLLHYSDIGADNFLEKLEGNEKEVYDGVKNAPWINIYGEIKEPSQLDMLWATFMASGSYQPILKLIQTLDFAVYQGELDKFKESQQAEEDRQKAMNDAVYQSLVWSIGSNMEIHGLVKSYCNWALRFENLSALQKSELKKIMEK